MVLHAPADTVSARHRWLHGTLVPIDDERCEYRTGDHDLDWLAIRVGMLGVDFEVLEPPELAVRLRELAGRFARAAAAP